MKILEPATYLGTRTGYLQAHGLGVSITSYQPGEPLDTSFHAHVNPHLTLLLQGGTLEKRQRGQYERRTGESVFFHAGEGHQNSHTLLPSKNINLEFGADFLRAYGISETAMGEALTRSPDTAFLPLRMYTELQAADACSADSIAMLVLNVLGSAPRGQQARPPWARQAEAMLRDCWNQPVSLSELAAAAGVHPVTLSKQFPRYFGATLGQYVRKLRVSRALTLIQNTPLSLTQVAHECGFYDQIHFTRTFRECTGLLPKAFKKM
ncbi:MAG: helix-turn-helix transcriptional regulator [Cytophagales bacterium]|nr:helix-turn-helix transcriptional regulator [Cytophagales bacterium]